LYSQLDGVLLGIIPNCCF